MTTRQGQALDALAAVQESIRRAAEAGEMDQRRAPMLEALEAYHAIETVSFSIPAHKGGGAIDEATRSIVGIDPYRPTLRRTRGWTTGSPAELASRGPRRSTTAGGVRAIRPG